MLKFLASNDGADAILFVLRRPKDQLDAKRDVPPNLRRKAWRPEAGAV